MKRLLASILTVLTLLVATPACGVINYRLNNSVSTSSPVRFQTYNTSWSTIWEATPSLLTFVQPVAPFVITADPVTLTLKNSDTSVVSSQVLGRLQFQTADSDLGNTDVYVASVEAFADDPFVPDNHKTGLKLKVTHMTDLEPQPVVNVVSGQVSIGQQLPASGVTLDIFEDGLNASSIPTLRLTNEDTAVSLAQVLGRLQFRHSDSQGALNGAEIVAVAEGDFDSTINRTVGLSFKVNDGDDASPVERLSVSGSGNVGVTGNLTVTNTSASSSSAATIANTVGGNNGSALTVTSASASSGSTGVTATGGTGVRANQTAGTTGGSALVATGGDQIGNKGVTASTSGTGVNAYGLQVTATEAAAVHAASGASTNTQPTVIIKEHSSGQAALTKLLQFQDQSSTPVASIDVDGQLLAAAATLSSLAEPQLVLQDTSGYSMGVGASLTLSGKYHSSGTFADFATFKSYKESISSGNQRAFLSISTNNGTSPTEALRLTADGDAIVTGKVFARGRSAAEGEWTSVAHDDNNFDANGPGTPLWTVEAGDQTTYQYTLVGKTCTVMFNIQTSTTDVGGGTISYLSIDLPAGIVVAEAAYSIAYTSNDSGVTKDLVDVWTTAAGTKINLSKLTGVAYGASTNTVMARGQITFEIQ